MKGLGLGLTWLCHLLPAAAWMPLCSLSLPVGATPHLRQLQRLAALCRMMRGRVLAPPAAVFLCCSWWPAATAGRSWGLGSGRPCCRSVGEGAWGVAGHAAGQ